MPTRTRFANIPNKLNAEPLTSPVFVARAHKFAPKNMPPYVVATAGHILMPARLRVMALVLLTGVNVEGEACRFQVARLEASYVS